MRRGGNNVLAGVLKGLLMGGQSYLGARQQTRERERSYAQEDETLRMRREQFASGQEQDRKTELHRQALLKMNQEQFAARQAQDSRQHADTMGLRVKEQTQSANEALAQPWEKAAGSYENPAALAALAARLRGGEQVPPQAPPLIQGQGSGLLPIGPGALPTVKAGLGIEDYVRQAGRPTAQVSADKESARQAAMDRRAAAGSYTRHETAVLRENADTWTKVFDETRAATGDPERAARDADEAVSRMMRGGGPGQAPAAPAAAPRAGFGAPYISPEMLLGRQREAGAGLATARVPLVQAQTAATTANAASTTQRAATDAKRLQETIDRNNDLLNESRANRRSREGIAAAGRTSREGIAAAGRIAAQKPGGGGRPNPVLTQRAIMLRQAIGRTDKVIVSLQANDPKSPQLPALLRQQQQLLNEFKTLEAAGVPTHHSQTQERQPQGQFVPQLSPGELKQRDDTRSAAPTPTAPASGKSNRDRYHAALIAGGASKADADRLAAKRYPSR